MWLTDLFQKNEGIAHAVIVIGLVALVGLALGSIKIRGVSLGIPGVLFAGLFFRHIGLEVDAKILFFVRDFGLILFVYAVGVQVGPGFLASLRRRGLPLSMMAAAICLLGALLTMLLVWVAKVDVAAAVGLFAGGTTNAPALASASEALKEGGRSQAVSSFAVAYPFGLFGVILGMIFLRKMFRIDPQKEADLLEQLEAQAASKLDTMNIELQNANLNNLQLSEFPSIDDLGVVVSRVFRTDTGLEIARPETRIRVGDVLLAVGPAKELNELRLIVGAQSLLDLRELPSQITTRQVLVTHAAALGKTIDELDLARRLGVNVTRVSRAEIELTPTSGLRLQFGDRVRAVGDEKSLDAAAKLLGNSVRQLNLPRLMPIFLGILLGVVLGMWPVFIPGMPAPIKLGLAAGPMIVAIALSRIGRIGPVIWYMPHNASSLLKELGIVLFLVGVGIQAGAGFVHTLSNGDGFYWMALGAGITILPLMIVGFIAMKVMKMNYLHVCGLLAGSMTSPSLAFTATMTPSEAPAVAFATVYPLTMILRVLLAQVMVLVLA